MLLQKLSDPTEQKYKSISPTKCNYIQMEEMPKED